MEYDYKADRQGVQHTSLSHRFTSNPLTRNPSPKSSTTTAAPADVEDLGAAVTDVLVHVTTLPSVGLPRVPPQHFCTPLLVVTCPCALVYSGWS